MDCHIGTFYIPFRYEITINKVRKMNHTIHTNSLFLSSFFRFYRCLPVAGVYFPITLLFCCPSASYTSNTWITHTLSEHWERVSTVNKLVLRCLQTHTHTHKWKQKLNHICSQNNVKRTLPPFLSLFLTLLIWHTGKHRQFYYTGIHSSNVAACTQPAPYTHE